MDSIIERRPCLSTMLSRSTLLPKAQTWCVGADGEVYDDGQSRALLGALYMPTNQYRLVEALASASERFEMAASADASFPDEVLWVVPDTGSNAARRRYR